MEKPAGKKYGQKTEAGVKPPVSVATEGGKQGTHVTEKKTLKTPQKKKKKINLNNKKGSEKLADPVIRVALTPFDRVYVNGRNIKRQNEGGENRFSGGNKENTGHEGI